MPSDKPLGANAYTIGGQQKDIDPSEPEMMSSNQPSVIINQGGMEVRITREVLEQHAVGNLETVARHLQVGKTTFQTICRNYGIGNWRSFWKPRARKTDQDSLKAAQEHIVGQNIRVFLNSRTISARPLKRLYSRYPKNRESEMITM
ncbi:hypothetical protein LIER_15755 [Lithospermum erythrorhizon]|uniref:RWP-RK domain-containing protein n=1 Tax=Lithospermum erythrorhizon TaxID=34254 RepID=A0AAV3Q415_LITER